MLLHFMDLADAELRLPVAQVPLLQLQSLLDMGERGRVDGGGYVCVWGGGVFVIAVYVVRLLGCGGNAGARSMLGTKLGCCVGRAGAL